MNLSEDLCHDMLESLMVHIWAKLHERTNLFLFHVGNLFYVRIDCRLSHCSKVSMLLKVPTTSINRKLYLWTASI